MREGWLGDVYVVFFEGDEVVALTERYGLTHTLPGYRVLGLRGWNDFIVADESGRTFVVPVVPAIKGHLEPMPIRCDAPLFPDEGLRGKVKWYVTPLVLGGTAVAENTVWLSLQDHVIAVRYWNHRFMVETRADG
jgi:hypothetical protein